MTLTKRDLVIRITSEPAAVERKLIQQDVQFVIQRTLDLIAAALADRDKVELRNFGVFEVRIRKGRIGRNPHQPDVDVPIPQRAVVKFKAGKEMRTAVLKLTPPPARSGRKASAPAPTASGPAGHAQSKSGAVT
jgi:nucleoid DNA-binding protein